MRQIKDRIKFDVVIKRDNVTVDLGTITDDLLPVVSIHTTASVKIPWVTMHMQ